MSIITKSILPILESALYKLEDDVKDLALTELEHYLERLVMLLNEKFHETKA